MILMTSFLKENEHSISSGSANGSTIYLKSWYYCVTPKTVMCVDIVYEKMAS